jgi:hypothetical protein
MRRALLSRGLGAAHSGLLAVSCYVQDLKAPIPERAAPGNPRGEAMKVIRCPVASNSARALAGKSSSAVTTRSTAVGCLGGADANEANMFTRLKLAFDDMRFISRMMVFLAALVFAIALLRGDIVWFNAEETTNYL